MLSSRDFPLDGLTKRVKVILTAGPFACYSVFDETPEDLVKRSGKE